MSGVELSGIRFPFRFSSSGGVETAKGAQKVRTNLMALITTKKNERPLRPEAGTIGYSRLLRSATETSGLISALIAESIFLNEPRVSGLKVAVRVERRPEGNAVISDVGFQVQGSAEQIPMSIELT